MLKALIITFGFSCTAFCADAANADGVSDAFVSVPASNATRLDVMPCGDVILFKSITFESIINNDVVFNNVIEVDFMGRDERRPSLTANYNQGLTANIASLLDYEVGWRNTYTL